MAESLTSLGTEFVVPANSSLACKIGLPAWVWPANEIKIDSRTINFLIEGSPFPCLKEVFYTSR